MDGKFLTRITDRTYKRIVAETFRDDVRRRAVSGTEKNFLVHYGHLGWTSAGFYNLRNAFKQTKNANIDHRFPIDFFILYKEGKYLEFCIHSENLYVTGKDHNAQKGCSIPCLNANNQHTVILANAMGVDPDEFRNALNLYENDYDDFMKYFSFDNFVEMSGATLLKLENASYDITDFT